MRKPTLILLLLAACIPDYKDADVKLVGVGYNPDEIGPSPTPYGGVVEYSLINFSGAGLSLAMMQLGSLGEISEANFGSKAPYRAVYGFSYMFDSQLTAADSLGGVTSKGLGSSTSVVGSCDTDGVTLGYTTAFEAAT